MSSIFPIPAKRIEAGQTGTAVHVVIAGLDPAIHSGTVQARDA